MAEKIKSDKKPYEENYITKNGKVVNAHFTDHGSPKSHSNPHAHDLNPDFRREKGQQMESKPRSLTSDENALIVNSVAYNSEHLNQRLVNADVKRNAERVARMRIIYETIESIQASNSKLIEKMNAETDANKINSLCDILESNQRQVKRLQDEFDLLK